MILNIFLSAIMYPVIVIMFIVCYVIGKNTSRYVFGVTLKKEQKNSDQVKAIIKEYKRDCLVFFLLLSFEPFIAFVFDKVSLQFTIWICWFLIAIFVMQLPFVRANKKALLLKEDDEEEIQSLEYVELKSVRTLKNTELIYPLMLSIIPPVYLIFASLTMNLSEYKKESYLIYGGVIAIFALTSVLFAFLAKWMDKRRTLVINGDSDVNQNYSRAVKRIWKKFWLRQMYINAAVIILAGLATVVEISPILVLIIASCIEAGFSLIMLLIQMRQVRKIEAAYESKFEISKDADQDKYWKYGMYYYNRNDKNTMVDKRFGTGTTINMATKAGMASTIIGILAIIWIPFMCIFLIAEDFTPQKLIYQNDKIICRQLKDDYVIEEKDILSIELVDELPSAREKVVGTSTDYREKGKFRTKEEGDFYEFVNTSYEGVIRIQTKDRLYYINGESLEETLKLYQSIQMIDQRK